MKQGTGKMLSLPISAEKLREISVRGQINSLEWKVEQLTNTIKNTKKSWISVLRGNNDRLIMLLTDQLTAIKEAGQSLLDRLKELDDA